MIFQELNGHIDIELLSDGSYRLSRDYRVRVKIAGRWHTLVVPRGFITDFASVPWILRNLFPPMGKGISEASLLHDFLYRNPGAFTRAQIDRMFYDVMLELGTARWRARSMYAGVRAGGWKTWNRYRKAEKYGAGICAGLTDGRGSD